MEAELGQEGEQEQEQGVEMNEVVVTQEEEEEEGAELGQEEDQEEGRPCAPCAQWTDNHERVLQTWAQRASVLRALHEVESRRFKEKEWRFSLPVILLSSLASFVQFSSGHMPAPWQEYAGLFGGALSSAVALIGTLRTASKIEEKLQGHRAASIQYNAITRSITTELAVERGDRRLGGVDCVRAVADKLDRAVELAPIVGEPHKRKFLARLRRDARRRGEDEQVLGELPDALYCAPMTAAPSGDQTSSSSTDLFTL